MRQIKSFAWRVFIEIEILFDNIFALNFSDRIN